MRNISIALVLMSLLALAPSSMSGSPTRNVPTTAAVVGLVADPHGEAVAKANVSLLAMDGGAELTSATDERGHYEFRDILAGRYALKVAVAGFDAIDQVVVVGEGEFLTVDVRLKLAATNE